MVELEHCGRSANSVSETDRLEPLGLLNDDTIVFCLDTGMPNMAFSTNIVAYIWQVNATIRSACSSSVS
jgi:hypothetical protein